MVIKYNRCADDSRGAQWEGNFKQKHNLDNILKAITIIMTSEQISMSRLYDIWLLERFKSYDLWILIISVHFI